MHSVALSNSRAGAVSLQPWAASFAAVEPLDSGLSCPGWYIPTDLSTVGVGKGGLSQQGGLFERVHCQEILAILKTKLLSIECGKARRIPLSSGESRDSRGPSLKGHLRSDPFSLFRQGLFESMAFGQAASCTWGWLIRWWLSPLALHGPLLPCESRSRTMSSEVCAKCRVEWWTS